MSYVKYKTCASCKSEKMHGEFYRHSASPDGVQSYCKVCAISKNKQWLAANLDKSKAANKEWEANNREKRTLQRRIRDEKNREILNRKAKAWRDRNKEKIYKSYDIKKRYSLTSTEYDAIYKSQNGCCAICGCIASTYIRGLCVDHNHKTGKVRGLLCAPCKAGLGMIKENIATAIAMVEYIKKHQG